MHKLRRTISEILEHIDAIEYAVGLYQHKGNHTEVERAREDFQKLRREIDRLGGVIAGLEEPETGADRVMEAAE
jgi:hypothetical protein